MGRTQATGVRPGDLSPAFLDSSPFDSLLPEGIAVVATRTEVEAPLFRAEESVLASAVASRCREFVSGRACAREALARLGVTRQAIPADDAGAPRWPRGIVGSITHCDGLRAAAVGRKLEIAALGIDAEPDRPLPAGALDAIALPVERERVRQLLRKQPGPSWDRLLFSAKESVFKAWHPLTGMRLGFEGGEIAFGAGDSRFSVRLRTPQRQRTEAALLHGRWSAEGGLLATAVVVPAMPGG